MRVARFGYFASSFFMQDPHPVDSYRLPQRPRNGKFAAGPTRKLPYPGQQDTYLGISHRSPQGLALIQRALDLMRKVLQIPASHKIALVAGGGTGSVEFLLWNLLGTKSVDVFSEGVFGDHWAHDVREELKLSGQTFRVPIGTPVDFSSYIPEHDTVIVWNETPSGTRTMSTCFDNSPREGLIICDAVASVFCERLPWEILDAVGFSWQKGIGGEAGLGTIVLGPRALARLEATTPPWPIPRLFRLPRLVTVTEDCCPIDPRFFEGCVVNTISLMVVEDMVHALEWAQAQGGLEGLLKRVEQHGALIEEWVGRRSDVDFLVQDASRRAYCVPCLTVRDPQTGQPADWPFLRRLAFLLETQAGITGILNHAQSVPSLRFWLGPVVEDEDIQCLLAWLDWALDRGLC